MFNSHSGGLALLIAWLLASFAHDTVVLPSCQQARVPSHSSNHGSRETPFTAHGHDHCVSGLACTRFIPLPCPRGAAPRVA